MHFLYHSEFEMYNCFMVKDLSLAFIFGSCVLCLKSVESVIDVLMGKSSGGIQWIIVIRCRNYTKFTMTTFKQKNHIACYMKSFYHLSTIFVNGKALSIYNDATINFIR